MRTFGVVVDAPHLDDDLRFFEAVEDFTIEAFIPEFALSFRLLTIFFLLSSSILISSGSEKADQVILSLTMRL